MTTPLRLKPWGFYGLTPMHCSPSANRSFSLLDTLRVLRNRLPVPTSYTQLLKSRIGRTLSLFNFCRYISDRLFYDNIVSTHGFCEKPAYMAQISIFRGSPPHLVAAHLAIFGGFAPISPHIRVRRLPCE